MQGRIENVDLNPRLTKTGKTYYRIQLTTGEWLSVYNQYDIGDVLSYEEGNLPEWPRKVTKVDHFGTDRTPAKNPSPTQRTFGPTEYETLLHTVVEIAKRNGITDHQAIAALNNTLIISLQKKGTHIDVEGFVLF